MGVQRRGLLLSSRTIWAILYQRKRFLSWVLKDRIHASDGSGGGGGSEEIPVEATKSKYTLVGKPIVNVRGMRREL